MGGAKSKPYASGARSVVARRSLEPDVKQSVKAVESQGSGSAVDKIRASGQSAAAVAYSRHRQNVVAPKIDIEDPAKLASSSSPQPVPDEARFASNMQREQVKALKEAGINMNVSPPEEAPYWSTESSTIDRINNSVPTEKQMNANILDQMSKWDVVTSSVDEDAIKLRTEGETMATVVRYQQEAEMVKRYGRVPKSLSGKLTEDKMESLLRSVRDKPNSQTAVDIAKNHELKEDAVINLLKYTRQAVITSKGDNADSLLVGR